MVPFIVPHQMKIVLIHAKLENQKSQKRAVRYLTVRVREAIKKQKKSVELKEKKQNAEQEERKRKRKPAEEEKDKAFFNTR